MGEHMSEFQPTILGKVLPDSTTVYHDENCEVIKTGSVHELSITKCWHHSMESLADRYGVTFVVAMSSQGWDQESIEFLDRLPNLTRVHISTKRPLDWTPLERHKNVEDVSLWPAMPSYSRSRPAQGEIDFTKIPRLRRCSIPWIPEWDSIRQCSRLESLKIRDSSEIRELDLSRMHNLMELAIESCAELRKVVIPDDARGLALKISQTRKLKIDLKRYVRDVEYLWLEGKLAFSLDDLGEAKHLKKLMLTFLNNRVEIPPFLHKLNPLEAMLTMQVRLSESDRAIELKINAKEQEKRPGP